jgi:hypothetical protein
MELILLDRPSDSPQAPILPIAASPVSLQRKQAHLAGREAENEQWSPYLTDGAGRKCVGRDPMAIKTDILTASGHPRRSTRQLVSAFIKSSDGDCHQLEKVRCHGDVRRYACLPCVDDNAAEVGRCSTINCPFWPYRMGKNPHEPRRGRNAGVNPFEAA